MNRRILFAVLCGAVTLAAGSVSAQDDGISFVRELYVREVARHNAGGRANDAEFLSLFSRETQRVWISARDNKNPPPAPIGPVVNTFFGPGVLPGREVKFVRAGVAGGGAQLLVAFVDLLIDGNARKVHVYVLREGGAWRIDDIAYDPRESFVSYHRRRAGL